VHVQTLPLNTPQVVANPPWVPELSAAYAVSPVTQIFATGYDRMPGTFAAATSSAVNAPLPPIIAPQGMWFGCALCQGAPAQQQSFATLNSIQLPVSPGLPQSAVLFENTIDLTTLAQARFATNLGINTDTSPEPDPSKPIAPPGLLFGSAAGFAPAGYRFDDQYLVFMQPLPNQFALTVADTLVNHGPLPASTAAPVRQNDLIGTLSWNRNVDLTTDPNVLKVQFNAPVIVQYGLQSTANGTNLDIAQQFTLKHVPRVWTIPGVVNELAQPWDLIAPGRPMDLLASIEYVDRESAFLPPDAIAADSLAGLHGFAGNLTIRLREPLQTNPEKTLSLSASSWSFADSFPRTSNLSLRVAAPFGDDFQVIGNASRGSIATSLASAAAFAVPLADTAGGAAPLGQSNVEFDIGYAHGSLTYADPNHAAGGTFTTSWGSTFGVANQVGPECNVQLTILPCGWTRHRQVTAMAFVAGPDGFVTFNTSPSTLQSADGSLALNAGSTTPQNITSFVNRTTWALTGGVHLPQLLNDTCNQIVVAATNAPTPSELAIAQPGQTFSFTAFTEIVPLRSPVPLALFAGVAHSIANNATPVAGMPSSASPMFASTVTYAFKLTIGTEPGFRYNARDNSCVFVKPS
jgi:hypothetical protein